MDPLVVADAALAVVEDQQAAQDAGLHCDVYPVRIDPDSTEGPTYGEPRRMLSPGIQARAWGLPYFNGYTVTTRMHRDGECAAHLPKFKVHRSSDRSVIGISPDQGSE